MENGDPFDEDRSKLKNYIQTHQIQEIQIKNIKQIKSTIEKKKEQTENIQRFGLLIVRNRSKFIKIGNLGFQIQICQRDVERI